VNDPNPQSNDAPQSDQHSEDAPDNLLSRKTLARNSGFLLIGKSLPLLAAVVAIPWIIDAIGEARFGILAIGWMIMGYASMLDLGLGSAMVKSIADALGQGKGSSETPALFGTAFVLIVSLGMLGGVALYLLSPWVVNAILTIEPELQQEALWGFYALGLAIPISLAESGTRGLLEAHQKFDRLTPVHAAAGLFSYIGLMGLVEITVSVHWLILFLVGIKALAFLTYLAFGFHLIPSLGREFRFHRNYVSSMLQFGGWMTVNNIVVRTMSSLDRLLIGSLNGMKSVAHYATPLEIIVKMNVLPGAMASVLFPAYATQQQQQTSDRNLLQLPLFILQMTLVPVALTLILWGQEIIAWWISDSFATSSGWVIELLALGIVFNAMAHVPGTMLQGSGRPDLNAKLHLAELPIYAGLIWLGIQFWGIEGVAGVRTLRVFTNCLVLMTLVNVVYDGRLNITKLIVPGLLVLGLALAITIFQPGWILKAILTVGIMVGWGVITWFVLLDPAGRTWIKQQWKQQETSPKNRSIE
jgi:O-antigen/teichoic acid export membrane protein